MLKERVTCVSSCGKQLYAHDMFSGRHIHVHMNTGAHACRHQDTHAEELPLPCDCHHSDIARSDAKAMSLERHTHDGTAGLTMALERHTHDGTVGLTMALERHTHDGTVGLTMALVIIPVTVILVSVGVYEDAMSAGLIVLPFAVVMVTVVKQQLSVP